MSSIADLRPGMIGFGPVDGWLQGPDMIGQFILGEGFSVGEVQAGHAFVVTEVMSADPRVSLTRFAAGNGFGTYAVEAMPSGARAVEISDRWTDRYAYVMLPEDYPGQAVDAAAIARAMIGTPYSFLSYAALAAWRFGWKTPKLEAWINRRHEPGPPMKRQGPWPGQLFTPRLPREAICSVLADQAWALTGKQVMPAGTPHQCVTPGALAGALLQMPGAEWLWPGR